MAGPSAAGGDDADGGFAANHVLDARIGLRCRIPMRRFLGRQGNRLADCARALEEDTSPRVDGLSVEETLQQVVRAQGDVTLEKQFLQASSNVYSQPGARPKRAYLGNIANTYRREDLAKAILMPAIPLHRDSPRM